MAKFSKINTTEAIERLKKKLGFKTDTELSNYLGISQQLISAWKSRNSLDIDLITTICDNISLDWLLLGIDKSGSGNKEHSEEVEKLKEEIELLKNKIIDLKEVIIDYSVNQSVKKREVERIGKRAMSQVKQTK